MSAGVSSTWWTRPPHKVVVASEGGDGSVMVPEPFRDINSVEGRPWKSPCGCWDDSDCQAAQAWWRCRRDGLLTPTEAKDILSRSLWTPDTHVLGIRCTRQTGQATGGDP